MVICFLPKIGQPKSLIESKKDKKIFNIQLLHPILTPSYTVNDNLMTWNIFKSDQTIFYMSANPSLQENNQERIGAFKIIQDKLADRLVIKKLII